MAIGMQEQFQIHLLYRMTLHNPNPTTNPWIHLPPSLRGVASMSGAPVGVRLQPGMVHLLHPTSHRIHSVAIVTVSGVDMPHALHLRGIDLNWYKRTLRFGIHLPRPRDAPPVFKVIKPSAVIGWLVRGSKLVYLSSILILSLLWLCSWWTSVDY